MTSQLYRDHSILTVLNYKKTGIQFIKFIKPLKKGLILCQVHQLRAGLPLKLDQTYKIGEYLLARIHEGEPRILKTLKDTLNPADQKLVLEDKYAVLLSKPKPLKNNKIR